MLDPQSRRHPASQTKLRSSIRKQTYTRVQVSSILHRPSVDNLVLPYKVPSFRAPTAHLQSLPHPLRQLHFPKLPRIQQALLTEIDVLHAGCVLRRRSRHAARDDDRVRLEDDTVVDDFVDRKGSEVVIFDEGALVGGVSMRLTLMGWMWYWSWGTTE